jgi:hypothetical protein
VRTPPFKEILLRKKEHPNPNPSFSQINYDRDCYWYKVKESDRGSKAKKGTKASRMMAQPLASVTDIIEILWPNSISAPQ